MSVKKKEISVATKLSEAIKRGDLWVKVKSKNLPPPLSNWRKESGCSACGHKDEVYFHDNIKRGDKKIKELEVYTNDLEDIIAELIECLEPTYSGSPEGRKYLEKCRKTLARSPR